MSLSSACDAPQEDGQQGEEHAQERAADHDGGAETHDDAAGVHRVAHEVVRSRSHELLLLLRRHGLAPVATKLLAGGDEKRHADKEHRQPDDAQCRPDRRVVYEAEERYVWQREGE